MIPSDWMPHRRDTDGELAGYLRFDGENFTPLTVFGYPLASACAFEEAEVVLNERGLSVLIEQWLLALPDGEVAVSIQEVTPDYVRVVEDPERMANVVGATLASHTLDVPVPPTFRLPQ
ncbi:MAG: hypothetical protein ACK5H2_11420 [Beutenbergiaceae bacterium]